MKKQQIEMFSWQTSCYLSIVNNNVQHPLTVRIHAEKHIQYAKHLSLNYRKKLQYSTY
jgi:hypothetical protein